MNKKRIHAVLLEDHSGRAALDQKVRQRVNVYRVGANGKL
jgi:hypothetical protein